MTTKESAKTVVLQPYHKNQKKVADHPARFKVVNAGRRFGKSRLALFECLDRAINYGETVWWVSPTYNNVNTHWRVANAMIGHLATYKNVQQKYIEFHINGRKGSLSFKSGDRPDNLRGEGLDLCVLDEAAYIADEVWEAVIRPALSDKKGRALIISTPNGVGDWFHRAYLRGLDPLEPEWQSWHFRTVDNKAIEGMEEEVASAKKDLTDLRFRQEYLAEFVDYSGGVFFGLQEAAIFDGHAGPQDGYDYVFGVDLGRRNDYTVVQILGRKQGQEYIDDEPIVQAAIHRYADVMFTKQMEHIEMLAELWNPVSVRIEENSIGLAIVEMMEEDTDLPIVAVNMSNTLKGELVENLSANIQRGRLLLLSDEHQLGAAQLGELRAFEMSKTTFGNIRYAAKAGWHDDLVMSLMIANAHFRFKKRKSGMKSAVNPFY